MTKVQEDIYKEVLTNGNVRSLLRDYNPNKDCIFVFINALRKLCNHPSLVDTNTNNDEEGSNRIEVS